MKYGFAIKPEFVIKMHEKEKPMLEVIQKNFGFGRIKPVGKNKVRFGVIKQNDLIKSVSGFQYSPLMSSKAEEFELRKEAANIISNKTHLSQKDIQRIFEIRESLSRMGTKGSREKSQKFMDFLKLVGEGENGG